MDEPRKVSNITEEEITQQIRRMFAVAKGIPEDDVRVTRTEVGFDIEATFRVETHETRFAVELE